MADSLYPSGRDAFLQGNIDWVADTIKVALYDTDVTAYSSAHDNYDDISSAVVGTPYEVTSNAAQGDGIADATDAVFTSVTGAECEAVVIYKDTGTPGTSTLIAYIDSATNLPVTPTGGDITVAWANSSNYIFKL